MSTIKVGAFAFGCWQVQRLIKTQILTCALKVSDYLIRDFIRRVYILLNVVVKKRSRSRAVAVVMSKAHLTNRAFH